MFYVWFDAPIEYIGATKEWADAKPGERDWKRWWYDADDVRYVEFMGKDNVPFHTVSFPATIMGSGEPWKLVDHLKGFSTGSTTTAASSRPARSAASSWTRRWRIPGGLLALLPDRQRAGDRRRLVHLQRLRRGVQQGPGRRARQFRQPHAAFCSARFGDAVPAGGEPGDMEFKLAADLLDGLRRYSAALEAMQLRRAAEALRELWVLGNVYVDHAAPWTAIKTDKDRAAVILRVAINLIRLYAIVGSPIIPDTCARLRQALGIEVAENYWPSVGVPTELQTLQPGHKFTVPPPLFKKIAPEEVADLAQRYGGEEGAEAAA